MPTRYLREQQTRGGADRLKTGAHLAGGRLSLGPQQDVLEEGQGGQDSGAQDRGQGTLRGQERVRGNGAEGRAWSADFPIEMVAEAPERGPSLSLATGGLGEAEGKAEWAGRKWRPLHPACLLSPPPPLPPQTEARGLGAAYRLTPAAGTTGATPPLSPL